MPRRPPAPVVHVELHTANLARACGFCTELFGWRAETVHLGDDSYLALHTKEGIEAGIVEEEEEGPWWLPYVEVPCVGETVEAALALGAAVPLEPREGPAGWRAVVAAPGGGRIALWGPKT
jgi:predicted enzyme related to lactoylglutathione lyase